MDNFTLILMIFVLALFVGFEIITKVPPILHTPLMSGSNVISGITLVGAILSAGTQRTTLTMILGFMAVVFATVNAVWAVSLPLQSFRASSQRNPCASGETSS